VNPDDPTDLRFVPGDWNGNFGSALRLYPIEGGGLRYEYWVP